jgi:hypothetical protein
MSEPTQPLTLAQRLAAVMGDVGYVQKGGKTQSGPSFKYVKHDDVVALVRPALVKHGVAFLATVRPETVSCVEHGATKSGSLRYKTTLILDMTFVNADDPGDAYSVSFPGEGIDTDDKGSGKALSYAIKNGLLKTFMIESGDDADNEATTQEAAPRSQAVRHDEQREQAAAQPPRNGNGTLTANEVEKLRAVIHAKGRTDESVLATLKERYSIGDGESLESIPREHLAGLLEILAKIPDPEPPAAAPVPQTEVAEVAALATQEAAAPAAASDASEALAAQVRPDGCTLDHTFQTCAQIKAGQEPQCESCQYHDADWKPLDAATRRDAQPEAEKPSKRGTVTEPQLLRVVKQTAELEELGVGRDEWRLWMSEKFGVSSRTQLMKTTTAPQCIDALKRWLIDLKTGVSAPGEMVA